MPQVFQVLKCYKCSVFQIHQTKKANKFICKMCGEKQSIKRHYGIGTGKDCRMHVQKLNVLRGNLCSNTSTESNSDDENDLNATDENTTQDIENSGANPVKKSKWSAFLNEEKETESTEEPAFLGDREVVLELPQKRKTNKLNVKAKASNSEEYLHNINSNSKTELKVSYKNRIHNEPEEILQDVLGNNKINTVYKDQSCSNIDNVTIDEPLEQLSVLQTVNKNSKWAQYVDTREDKDLHSVVMSNEESKECVKNPDNLFSLCDDNDLDQVLEI